MLFYFFNIRVRFLRFKQKFKITAFEVLPINFHHGVSQITTLGKFIIAICMQQYCYSNIQITFNMHMKDYFF